MKNYIALVAIVFLYSCKSQKLLLKGNYVYTYQNSNGAEPSPIENYQRHQVDKNCKVTIQDAGDHLIIKSGTHIKTDGNSTNFGEKKIPDWKVDSKNDYYFPETSDDKKQRLFYMDSKVVLQTASIPLKIRPKISEYNIPSQTETGFNVGFVFGYKLNLNKFTASKNTWGVNTSTFSITPGFCFSTGAADLSTAATHPVIDQPRKAAMVSGAALIVLGFNHINIGYAIGRDYAIGVGAPNWIYQDITWHGIIVSLDLIK